MQQMLEKIGTRATLSGWSQRPKKPRSKGAYNLVGCGRNGLMSQSEGWVLGTAVCRCHLYSRLAACLFFVCLGSASSGLALL